MPTGRRRPAARRDDRRQPRAHASRASPEREALVVAAPGHPADLRRARRRGRPRSRAACWPRASRKRRPRRHLGAELRRVGRRAVRDRVGAILVNINPAYRTHELDVRAEAVGRAGCSSRRRAFKTQRLRRDGRRGARRAARRSSGSIDLGTRRTGTALARRRRERRRRRAGRARGRRSPSTTRSTSSTRAARPASRRARRSRTTTSSTTASSSGECCGYTEARPRLHPGAVLPLLRHGAWATSPAPRTAPAWSIPARAFDAGATLEAVEAERCTSLYGVPDDVHRRARAPRLRPASTSSRCAPGSWPARRARSR